MKWIYLSPHLDDAVYSCGALIHQQVQHGLDVEIRTIFAGQFDARKLSDFAKDIHQRWGTGLLSVQARRLEDHKACAMLGCVPLYYNFKDVIYRYRADGIPEIIKNDDLFRDFQPADVPLKESIKSTLQKDLLGREDIQVCVPLGLGNHIDHQIVKRAADEILFHNPPYYYADFPYVVREKVMIPQMKQEKYVFSKAQIEAWCSAIALYTSQISTFWEQKTEICEEIVPYWQNGGAGSLWISEQ